MSDTNTNFVDYVKIHCRSGHGGGGSSHMHRAKYLPKGGPDGGDGGRGGHIILRANKNYWTLIHLKFERHIFAGHGGHGGDSRSTGKDGEDKIIEVPCGTIAYDADSGEYLCEVTTDKEEIILLKGGRGGLGNWNFKSATNQTPHYSQPGEPAIERNIILELKVLADVGLVGFPNAGKSTLLSSVSAAKPKIANYPFTTLVPNLGIVPYRDSKSFAMADIPGIIEGASDGKGLGLRFLRHIERNAILLFLVSADSNDVMEEYNILIKELGNYNEDLLTKQRILAVSKADLLDKDLIDEIENTLPKDVPHIFFSSVSGFNLTELKDLVWNELSKDETRHAQQTITHRNLDISTIEDDFEEIEVFDDEWDDEDDSNKELKY